MSSVLSLGEFEHFVLLAILRVGEHAYGVNIKAEIAACTGREPTTGALYTTLDRLEEKGMVASRMGDPTPLRGGRAKRYYAVTGVGLEAVAQAQRAYRRLTKGLKIPGVARA